MKGVYVQHCEQNKAMAKRHLVCALVSCALLLCAGTRAQQKGAPLKNETVVSMVKGGMPESVIVSVIQTSETQFDVSEQALTDLKKAGVSQKVVDAMAAAEARKTAAPAATKSSARAVVAASAAPGARPQPPYVLLIQEKSKQNLPAERAQIAQVNTKTQDLNALALEAIVEQALAGLAADVSAQAARGGSAMAGSLGQAAGGVFGSLMKARKPTFTYVWALAPLSSSTALPTNTPKFEVFHEGIPGVNAGEYAPVLVKLVPARNGFRLVGAAKGKEGALQGATPDWELYSSFVEEKVPTSLNKLAPGRIEVTPVTPLQHEEYALVLRPLAKNKKFSGTELTNNLGEGALFNSVWTILVRPAP